MSSISDPTDGRFSGRTIMSLVGAQPAPGPPQSDLLTGLLDQTPTSTLSKPEPVPDY